MIPGFDPWVGKIPWRRKWQSTPVLLPGKSHGQSSLVGYSPWGVAKSRTRLSDFTFQEDLSQGTAFRTAATSALVPGVSHCQPMPSTGDLPTPAGGSGSISCGVIVPVPWVLVNARFCLYPQRVESLFPPVLWKFCNQIPLAFKFRFPGDFQSVCQSPKLRSLTWSSDPSQQWENFFGIIVLRFVCHSAGRYGI